MTHATLDAIAVALDGEDPDQHAIAVVGLDVVAMLLEKNRAYGNSATQPIRVFSQLSAIEGIHIRMDDKLSRIRNGAAVADEDPIYDLAGYCILELVSRKTNPQ